MEKCKIIINYNTLIKENNRTVGLDLPSQEIRPHCRARFLKDIT